MRALLTNDLYIPFVNVTLTCNRIVYLIFAALPSSVGLRQLRELSSDGIDGLALQRHRRGYGVLHAAPP
ncbi:MAG: hypothetical protein ACLU38_09450 [Dysosmobacter sp.]